MLSVTVIPSPPIEIVPPAPKSLVQGNRWPLIILKHCAGLDYCWTSNPSMDAVTRSTSLTSSATVIGIDSECPVSDLLHLLFTCSTCRRSGVWASVVGQDTNFNTAYQTLTLTNMSLVVVVFGGGGRCLWWWQCLWWWWRGW
jgi:hypothetical protein